MGPRLTNRLEHHDEYRHWPLIFALVLSREFHCEDNNLITVDFEIHLESVNNHARDALIFTTRFSVKLTHGLVRQDVLCIQDELSDKIQGFFRSKMWAAKSKQLVSDRIWPCDISTGY